LRKKRCGKKAEDLTRGQVLAGSRTASKPSQPIPGSLQRRLYDRAARHQQLLRAQDRRAEKHAWRGDSREESEHLDQRKEEKRSGKNTLNARRKKRNKKLRS